MSILTGGEAQSLVQSMIEPETQTQMCGIELTVQRIERFSSAGAISFDNSERELPRTEPMDFDLSGWIELAPGAYLVTFNEIVKIPLDVAALARPRSTLQRCGATMETALWDPGYRGRSQSLLVVYNPQGLRLKRNARLMQLVFMNLCKEAEKGYTGRYQGENIKIPK
jgi:dUTP pyrophosphatase